MTTPSAILFDLDGTLTDTLADLANTSNEVLSQYGYPTHPLAAYRHFVGDGARKLIERAIGADADLPTIDAVYAAFLDRYDQRCLETVRPYEGVPFLLDALHSRGIAMGIVTNKPEPQALRITAALFPSLPFIGVRGGRPDRPKKPDPTAALSLLTSCRIAPAQCWFVGDSDVDMLTAQNLGCPGIGAVWGFRGEMELRTAGATLLAQTPLEVLRLLEETQPR